MVCDEGEGCSTTSRVADEMEPVDVPEVGFTEDPLRLGIGLKSGGGSSSA